MRICAAACAALTMAMLAGCARESAQPAPKPPADSASTAAPGAPWPAFVERFIEARMKADPYFAVQSGRHEFDGQMPDWSRAALDAEVARMRALRAELDGFDPAALAPAQRFEREFLAWVMDTQIFWLSTADQPFRN